MSDGCGEAPEGSWVPHPDSVATTFPVTLKLGEFGLETERLKIILAIDQEERMVSFDITQDTFSGGHGGYKAIIEAHTENGTLHQHWFERSTNDWVGIAEMLETITEQADVSRCYDEKSTAMAVNWENNKLRWKSG